MDKYAKNDAAEELAEEIDNKEEETAEKGDEAGEGKDGMVSMMRSKEEKKKEKNGLPTSMDVEDYDYGLRIELNNENLDKLGIKTLPKVGDTMTVEAKVEVTSTGENAGKDGESKNVSLQITDMKLE